MGELNECGLFRHWAEDQTEPQSPRHDPGAPGRGADGISGYISQIERGVTKISLDTLAAVATRLECELAELVTGVAVSQEHYLDRELAQLVHRMDGQQRHLLYEMARLILKNVRPLEEASG